MEDRLLVIKVIAHIEKNLTRDIGTQELVEYSGYSLNRLRQKFFNVTGDSPSGYMRKRRLTEAAREILDGHRIVDVCLKYRYSSQENFTTSFRTCFGVTPKEVFQINQKYRTFISRLRDVYTIMEIAGLQQLRFNTTLMGCLKGASDFFDMDLTPAMLFGLSGHAFLINIHDELCPSGPYVWKKEAFRKCVSNIGIEFARDFEFQRDASIEERKEAEKYLKDNLNGGRLGILNFMEHQLFSGYDEDGFQFLMPWDCKADSETRRLTYSTWTECLEGAGWVGFSVIRKGEMKHDLLEMTKDAISLGLDFFRNSEKHQYEKYRIGYGAYESWIESIKQGRGTSHGHWWNGMVWAECRRFAAAFFTELEEMLDEGEAKKVSIELAGLYGRMSEHLAQIKEKELGEDEKIRLLGEVLELEQQAEPRMEQLLKVAS